MKILWVKAGKLLPVDAGGKIRSYNILRHLSARHSLTLLSYYGGARDEAYERAVAEQLPGAVAVYTAAPESTLGLGLDYLRRLPSPVPYAVNKFTDPIVKKLVHQWLTERRYDVAVCDFLSATRNFPAHAATPTVLFQHNVESLLWQRQAAHEANPVKRLAFKIEAAKMKRYEHAAVARFDHVIAVSDFDRQQMNAMTEAGRLSVVPTGVDLSSYRNAAGPSATEPLVMFLGSMDWEANVDGMLYFCRESWPAIKAAVPDARLRIVGRNPHQRIQQLAAADIEITGRVPSVQEHLREAAVFVVPLRIGGGTRLKIFEAMAMRKACVSTTIGAEGLDVTHGHDILLADDADSFARNVIELLQDAPRRAAFEKAAGETAARYDWSVITDRFEDSLRQAMRETRGLSQTTAATVPVNA